MTPRQTVIARAKRLGVNVNDALSWFDERAAIREFDGGMSRDEAEKAALGDVLRPSVVEGAWCGGAP